MKFTVQMSGRSYLTKKGLAAVGLGTFLVIAAALVLASCSPGNACERYGFKPGTVAFSQCVQNEWLAFQDRASRAAR